MRIYIIGKNGQLGFDLDRVLSKRFKVDGGGRETFDVRRVDEFLSFVKGKYDLIINCSAYLDVVKSEKYIKDSFLMNAILPSVISKFCYDNRIKFFHFSTDYVFDGRKRTPYVEVDRCDPLNNYGLSKYVGERMILENNPDAKILRVSGLYGKRESKSKGYNFVSFILKKAEKREKVQIVNDQFLTPTYTLNIAKQVEKLIDFDISGIIHSTDEGETSWYDFALEIKRVLKLDLKIEKRDSQDLFPKRPKYSVLENAVLKKNCINIMRNWKESLEYFLKVDLLK
ncbi:MAG: dTDP-4-dehydrorhamnose reductase [bacterium]|nr:dTDP-4-dehydrorhamnose reductase [bacterium]